MILEQGTKIPESLSFWTLSVVLNSKYHKTKSFGNSICFRLQVSPTTHLKMETYPILKAETLVKHKEGAFPLALKLPQNPR
jgi:hypothetical protein